MKKKTVNPFDRKTLNKKELFDYLDRTLKTSPVGDQIPVIAKVTYAMGAFSVMKSATANDPKLLLDMMLEYFAHVGYDIRET